MAGFRVSFARCIRTAAMLVLMAVATLMMG